jgi:hypothetical protein
MKTCNGYTRLQFVAFLRRTIPDFREADMHATAEDYETALQFIADDAMVMDDARKALLAASAHLPKDSNAAALVRDALAGLADVLDPPVKNQTPARP